jgi:glycosyltransferase involved in cell wall biosynthesis
MIATPEVSVVLPVYRNRLELPELHRRLRQASAMLGPTELIFVIDACPDGSLDALREIERDDPDVRLLVLKHRRGQHEALCAGLAIARAEIVLTMDADLQDPPEAIPAIVAKLREGFGAVYAGRRGRYESGGRLATSWLFKHALSALTGMPVDAGAFIAMRRDVAARVASLRGSRPYVPAVIAAIGRPVAVVPVVRERRPHGPSAYTPATRAGLAARAIVQVLRWRASSAFRWTR